MLTPIKSIRAKCIDCCCGDKTEVRLCTCTNCPLYPYRMGKRPKDTQIPAEELDTEKSRAYPPKVDESEAPNDGTEK